MGVKLKEHHGSFALFFNVNKQRKLHSLGTDVTKELAKKALQQCLAELALGVPLHQLKVFGGKQDSFSRTVATEWDAWIERAKANREIRDTSLEQYKLVYDKWVRPAIGHKPVATVTRADVIGIVTAVLGAGCKKRHARNVLRVVRRQFNQLIEDDKLKGADGHDLPNPALKLEKYTDANKGENVSVGADDVAKLEEANVVPRPFAADEACSLLGFYREKRKWQDYTMVCLGIKAGLRVGEIFGLHIDDVDFTVTGNRLGTITVRRTVVPGQRVHLTKNGRARVVDILSQELADALREQIRKQRARLLEKGWGSKPWLFLNEVGRLLDNSAWQYLTWRPVLKHLGLSGHVFHDCRHTFATVLYSKTRDLKYVSQQLGHASIKLTSDVYVQWINAEGAGYSATLLDDKPVRRQLVAVR